LNEADIDEVGNILSGKAEARLRNSTGYISKERESKLSKLSSVLFA